MSGGVAAQSTALRPKQTSARPPTHHPQSHIVCLIVLSSDMPTQTVPPIRFQPYLPVQVPLAATAVLGCVVQLHAHVQGEGLARRVQRPEQERMWVGA